jgi:hypothetical protein
MPVHSRTVVLSFRPGQNFPADVLASGSSATEHTQYVADKQTCAFQALIGLFLHGGAGHQSSHAYPSDSGERSNANCMATLQSGRNGWMPGLVAWRLVGAKLFHCKTGQVSRTCCISQIRLPMRAFSWNPWLVGTCAYNLPSHTEGVGASKSIPCLLTAISGHLDDLKQYDGKENSSVISRIGKNGVVPKKAELAAIPLLTSDSISVLSLIDS